VLIVLLAHRRTRRTRVLGDDDDDAAAPEATENVNTANVAPAVGGKRTQRGTAAAAAPARAAAGKAATAAAAAPSGAIMELSPETEVQLCAAVNDMLVQQRYVDEWRIEGVARWLQENKALTVSEELLERYFDRVDQSLTAQLPHVLYDVAEKTVHRDY
jgi:hypothetical protein